MFSSSLTAPLVAPRGKHNELFISIHTNVYLVSATLNSSMPQTLLPLTPPNKVSSSTAALLTSTSPTHVHLSQIKLIVASLTVIKSVSHPTLSSSATCLSTLDKRPLLKHSLLTVPSWVSVSQLIVRLVSQRVSVT